MSEELDPSEFVQRIRQLGEQRDQQDAERVRKLEEDLIQGRSERLARRAERARSLSPDKPSTPQSLRSAADSPRNVQEKATDTPTPTMDPPSQQSAHEDSLQRLTGSPAQVLEDDEPKKPTPSAAALGRSGTLSWQRRPQSGSIRRPLSMASSSADRGTTGSPHDTPEPSSPETNPSRNQIAQSLGAKDPSWFRQTPDRGIGSAAFRRNQEDSTSEAGSISGRRQLPGMSRESTAEPEATSPPPESIRSSSPSQVGSVRGSAAWSNRFSSNTSLSGGDAEPTGKLKSPLPTLDSQKFAPPSEQGSSIDGGDPTGSVRVLAMSPTQGRISPERDRPPSPTKGMGGFVQSAMMKRSDSVNKKRWSTQTPPAVSRQNSTLSNRGSTTGGYGTLSKMERPSSLSRENSVEPASRPGSSSSNLTITKDAADKDGSKGEFVKPALPHHSRSKSVASTFSEDNRPQDETSPPSPSKRWSPTKSSWLESALNKPESPKPRQPPPQQPAWMAEINRIKQQRGSVDFGKGSPLQSPAGDASGRSSPIKDVQLKPTSLRKPESPKKEEPLEPEKIAKPVQLSPKPKPALSSKPSTSSREEIKSPEEPLSSKKDPEESKEMQAPAPLKPKPVSQFSKEIPISSPATKPKPDTPPKKDFRAGLKPRQIISDAPTKDDVPEFQNVFGKLRKAETKNYVAPDTFKNNIVRGKNALNVTGGPKPSVRRDEFKESLISQKAAMLAKAQETGSAAHKRTDSSSHQTSTPEALAKRQNLGRSESISKPPPPQEKEATPEAISRMSSLRSNKPTITDKPPQPTSPFTPKESNVKSSKLADRFNPALAGMLARGPPPMTSNPPASGGDPSEMPARPTQEEKPGPAPELTHMTKGRARGPRRRAPGAKQGAAEFDGVSTKGAAVAAVPLVKSEHVLESSEPSKTNDEPEEPPVKKTPARDSFKGKPTTPAKSPDLSRKTEKPSSPELPRKPASLELGPRASTEVNSTPKKSPQPEPVQIPEESSPLPTRASLRASRSLPTPPSKPVTDSLQDSALKEISPPNAEISPSKEEPSPEKSTFSVKNATALWGRQSASSSPAPTRTKSPIKLPTKADEQAAMETAGLVRSPGLTPEPTDKVQTRPQAPKPKPIGLGLGSLGSLGGLVAARSRESSPPKPHSAKAFPATPPASDRPQSEPFKASPMPEKPDGIFTEFFDETPMTNGVLPENIDTVHILQTPPIDLGPSGKIRTLRKQIQEITGDGKLTPLPMQEEHVLFQDSMYLCTHVFGDSKGARTTEVYLWSGNSVAEPTLEDVQVFARNHTKQNHGKLFHIRQGKETPNFFEALGGIVITRRGSRPASKEYMLCGRRHLGHIAFDEVEFSLKSLCSGFAYIISTDTGKVYLWKGRGCSAEELSGARLMGMDLTPTGEFLEIDEGTEPPELFNVFPPTEGKGPAIPRSADHWRYKATNDKYRVRLFKIEQSTSSGGWGQGLQTPKSPLPPGTTTKVVEIMPFCQRDLEPEHIYVLDAFFEMYIIVGSLSRTQAPAFSTALMFAQEYSILAVSDEDRPFMPVATVVLEGVPRDMKAVFRHWDDRMISAAGLMKGKLGRGKSLRIVGLEKALEATRQ